jgi:CheY-like chemotaxis protein/HPt (histidine-containing phosphotransfer) domain-containing protein
VIVGHVLEAGGDLGVASRLTGNARLARIPLLLAPIAGMRGHALDVHAAGYTAYLPRPFRCGELYQCVRAVLRRSAPSLEGAAGQASDADGAMPLITRHRLADEQQMAAAGRVLIADDDPANLKVTRLQVERLGHPVDVVENGADAVAAVMRRDYQVVLMDCQMPTMNGLVATTEIRRLKDGSGFPAIVAVTAQAGEEWQRRCLQTGMDDVLEKPVRTHVLAEILNRYARTTFRSNEHQDVLATAAAKAGGLSRHSCEAAEAGGIDDLIADVGIELTLELAREYLTGVARALETIASGDMAATRHDAHRLLGGARTLSLTTFARLWLSIEELPSSQSRIPRATVDELRRACVELETWIERHHEKYRSEKHCA